MELWSRRQWLALGAMLSVVTQGLTQSVPLPNLDLKSLGQVALAGNFDSVSVYSSQGQKEDLGNGGTQSILSLLSNGQYDNLGSTDASIDTMCYMTLRDGSDYGVIVGGNFTSIGGQASRSVALFNASTSQMVPLPGIQGSVSALLCDNQTNTVYVGGQFEAGNSSNAIMWVAGTGWANLPFSGFDAPVSSIIKAPNGHIVFGGSFTGLGTSGNDPVVQADTTGAQKQVLNLVAANVTSVANTSTAGFGNPQNIVCPSNGTNGESSTWLLADNTPGSWRAEMISGFVPTLLRLWNTNQGGRGTKTWRFTAYPIDGILNMSYVDPAGKTAYCDATCPLAQNTSYQDFTFMNPIGMNAFQIDISDWYGSGGGLDGIQIFQDQIFVYAVEALDEPQCSGSTTPSQATTTGPWTMMPALNSTSNYMSVLTGPDNVNTTNIVLEPDLKEGGNYSILVYTPGCQQDNSCSQRGIVNVTGSLTSDGGQTFSTLLYQTNDNEKYDQVFKGKIDAASSSFRPSITISPSLQQDTQFVVASRIQFNALSSTFGLNGLFDYDPNELVNDNFSASAINNAGNMLHPNAQVTSLWVNGQTLYSAGQFSDDTFDNIMAFSNNNASSLPDGGLNGAVAAMYGLGDFLYVGGNFTNTSHSDVPGLTSVGAYQFSKNTWVALGSGLNGAVQYVVPTQLNISGSTTESVIAFSGSFTEILGSPSTSVEGLAIWVPSQKAWYENLNIARQALMGQLTANAYTTNGTWIGAGNLASNGLAISGAIGMTSSSGQVNLQQLPVKFSASSPQGSLSKRELTGQQNVSGVATGLYYNNANRNVTVLGGHFSATANGSTIENLLFLNGSNNDAVTGPPQGLDTNSTFLSLTVQGDLLFAGGSVSGNVDSANIDGLVVYDLLTAAYRSPQPAALSGANVVVNSIAVQTGTTSVYVGGSFDGTSQGLSCPSVCMYDPTTSQWNPVGSGLTGNVVALYWTSSTQMMAAGNLTVSGNSTSLATYNTKTQTWTTMQTSAIPGVVTAFAPASQDGSQVWVSGTAQNGSTFVVQVDGNTFRPAPQEFGSGTIIRSMEMMPLTKSHGSTPFMSSSQSLMVSGQLNLTSFGNAAVALFNGTDFVPLILTTLGDPTAGSVNSVFSQKTNPGFGKSQHHHSVGITVLVALCAALGTIFLIILLGIILERIQRHRAGYTAMPMAHQDKNSNINRVPPEQLFGSIGQRHSPPTV